MTLAITTPTAGALVCTTNPQGSRGGCGDLRRLPHRPRRHVHADRDGNGALTAAVSVPFTITFGARGQADRSRPNRSAPAGGPAFATQPVVTVQDAVGNTVTTNTSSVLLAITTPGGSVLGCTIEPEGRGRGRGDVRAVATSTWPAPTR